MAHPAVRPNHNNWNHGPWNNNWNHGPWNNNWNHGPWNNHWNHGSWNQNPWGWNLAGRILDAIF